MLDFETYVSAEICNVTHNNDTTGNDSASGATIASPVLMFLAGVLGNILALVVLKRTKSHSVFYILVGGLAWTDLIGILMTTPGTFASYLNGRVWFGGEAFCKFSGFAMVCFGLATPLIVCAMAVERFLAVRFTFLHSTHCNRNSARVTLVVIWIVVMVVGILPLFGLGRYAIQYPCTWCFLDFRSGDKILNAYGYLYASINMTAVLTMIICNGYVMFTLLKVRYLKQKAEKENGNLESAFIDGDKRNRKKRHHRSIELQMFVLMCGITSVFAVCWSPLMIHMLVTMSTGKSYYLMDLITIRLASLNQTLDPWLYILLRKSLIKKIAHCVKKLCCCPWPFQSSHKEDIFERNEHANHLRCFRKQCYIRQPHYHVQGQITPSGRCVVQFKWRSRSVDGGNRYNVSNHDPMKDTNSRRQESKHHAGGFNNFENNFDENHYQKHQALEFAKSGQNNEDSYNSDVKTKMRHQVSDSSESSDDENSTHPCRNDDMLSDSEEGKGETDVFVTKTTDLSADELDSLLPLKMRNKRRKLNSEVELPFSRIKRSGRSVRRTRSLT